MSELDNWFGPREPRETEPREHKTGIELLAEAMKPNIRKLLRCEDRIKSVLVTYFEVRGEESFPRSTKVRRQHYASARDFVEEFGEDDEAVRWCLQECNRRGVFVKDLRSLLFLAPTWRSIKATPKLDEINIFDAPIEFAICSRCNRPAYLDKIENDLCVECRMKEKGC